MLHSYACEGLEVTLVFVSSSFQKLQRLLYIAAHDASAPAADRVIERAAAEGIALCRQRAVGALIGLDHFVSAAKGADNYVFVSVLCHCGILLFSRSVCAQKTCFQTLLYARKRCL